MLLLVIVLSVNLYLWQRRAAMLRTKRARARIAAQEHRDRELAAAVRYFR